MFRERTSFAPSHFHLWMHLPSSPLYHVTQSVLSSWVDEHHATFAPLARKIHAQISNCLLVCLLPEGSARLAAALVFSQSSCLEIRMLAGTSLACSAWKRTYTVNFQLSIEVGLRDWDQSGQLAPPLCQPQEALWLMSQSSASCPWKRGAGPNFTWTAGERAWAEGGWIPCPLPPAAWAVHHHTEQRDPGNAGSGQQVMIVVFSLLLSYLLFLENNVQS